MREADDEVMTREEVLDSWPLLSAGERLEVFARLGRNEWVALGRAEQPLALLAAGYRTRGGAFTPAQIRTLRGIGGIASVALQNARLFEELEHANRLKSDFMSGMSHELRTPLNIIIGYGGLLLEGAFGDLREQQASTLKRMQATACELLALIQNTLDIDRLAAGRSPLQLSSVDVGALIGEVVDEAGPLWERAGLVLRASVGPGLPNVLTDGVKLKVVLTNLVSNAIKFTDRGEVRVAAREADGGVTIAVIDTGIGISAAALESIFEQFKRADHGERHFHGLGLGLYIVRRLVDLLSGTITVDSDVGRGSTFRLWIPRRPIRAGEGAVATPPR